MSVTGCAAAVVPLLCPLPVFEALEAASDADAAVAGCDAAFELLVADAAFGSAGGSSDLLRVTTHVEAG
jgi:hypothetical protein